MPESTSSPPAADEADSRIHLADRRAGGLASQPGTPRIECVIRPGIDGYLVSPPKPPGNLRKTPPSCGNAGLGGGATGRSLPSGSS